MLFDSVTLPPAQKFVVPLLTVIVASGNALTVTAVTPDVDEQPFPSVTTTV